jgi:2-dehydro-3-deoxyphosphogluconate aldolase/(4S)-4-hydroxy-2-oxoglutarate aldolase
MAEGDRTMPNKQDVLKSLKEIGVVAVIRADNPADLIDVGRALNAGGVNHIEITMTVPGALEVIEKAVSALKDLGVCIGAGTILDGETARLAILAGAGYIVSPVFRPDVVAVCKRYGVAVTPGAMTPLEVLDAWEGGADVVKIFPAGVGGPQFFKDLKGPFPHIEIMPTGAVNRETAPQFIKAGACAIGVGGELAGKPLIAARDYATITQNARDFVALVKGARA